MKKTYVTTCNHMSVKHALQSYGARNVGNVITRKSRAEQNYCHFNRPLQRYDCVAVFIGKILRVRFCRVHLVVSINFATDWKYRILISSLHEVTIRSIESFFPTPCTENRFVNPFRSGLHRLTLFIPHSRICKYIA